MIEPVRSGDAIAAQRQTMGFTKGAYAAWLSGEMKLAIKPAQITRWESGQDIVPESVLAFVFGRPSCRPGSMVTVVVGNQKGGVGKTALSVNLAYAMARMGYRSLLVDMDSQANATKYVGVMGRRLLDLEQRGLTLSYAFNEDRPVAEMIITTEFEALALLPSHASLAAAEDRIKARFPNKAEQNRILLKKLRTVAQSFDFCFLDCAPSLNIFTTMALTAARWVLIPVQTEPHALDAVEHFSQTVEEVQRTHNIDLEVLGLVPTMYMPRQLQDQQTLGILQERYGRQYRIFPPIPRTTIFAQGPALARPTLSFDPLAPGREVFGQIASTLLAASIPGSAAVAA